MDKEKHDKIAKEYAEKRKGKADFYYRLLFSCCFAIFIVLLDIISGIIPNTIKIISIIVLTILSYIFYRKWKYLTTKKIITAELPTGEILVGSEQIKFRTGGDKLIDKIKNFFKEM